MKKQILAAALAALTIGASAISLTACGGTGGEQNAPLISGTYNIAEGFKWSDEARELEKKIQSDLGDNVKSVNFSGINYHLGLIVVLQNDNALDAVRSTLEEKYGLTLESELKEKAGNDAVLSISIRNSERNQILWEKIYD